MSSRPIYIRRARAKLMEVVLWYLLENPCVDCGETDPRLLQFDHVRGEKFLPVSEMVSRRYGRSRLENEIGKCEVRCQHCHTLRHARAAGWFDTVREHGSQEIREVLETLG